MKCRLDILGWLVLGEDRVTSPLLHDAAAISRHNGYSDRLSMLAVDSLYSRLYLTSSRLYGTV